MRIQDTLWLGFKGLRERKLRAALTIFSVVIGVASIIALVSQTAGIEVSILNSIQTLGPTSIMVTPRASQLTQVDVAKISSVPGVSAVIPMVTERMILSRLGQSTPVTVIGVNSEELVSLLGEVRLIDGAVYPVTNAPLAVVGYNLAFPVSQGGSQTVYTGQPMVLEQQFGQSSRRVTLQVTGLLDRYGSTPLIQADDAVFLPLDAVMRMSNRRSFNILLVRAVDVGHVDSVTEFLTNIYGNSAQIITIQQLTQTVSSIIGQFGILLGAVAAISLTVAGLGIMNIMLVSVFERTREIGIFKAIGFRDRDILTLFLSEAAIIGIAGGITGVLTGSALSSIIPSLLTSLFAQGGQAPPAAAGPRQGQQGFGSQMGGSPFGGSATMSYTPVIAPEIIALSLLIAVAVSVVAGLYPAWRASRMEPIKALRYE